MAAAYKCDWCGEYFEHGFPGFWKKNLTQGRKQFDIDLKVSKSPHLCKKCWPKFCKLLFDDLKTSYVHKESIKSKI